MGPQVPKGLGNWEGISLSVVGVGGAAAPPYTLYTESGSQSRKSTHGQSPGLQFLEGEAEGMIDLSPGLLSCCLAGGLVHEPHPPHPRQQ